MNNPLSNEDLQPTTAAQRTWEWKDFAALWVGMVVCVPTYTMASSMLDQGFSWQMAVWLVFLANCIVLIPMVLIGRAGTEHGIPFPVLARASFGVKGANLPACRAARPGRLRLVLHQLLLWCTGLARVFKPDGHGACRACRGPLHQRVPVRVLPGFLGFAPVLYLERA